MKKNNKKKSIINIFFVQIKFIKKSERKICYRKKNFVFDLFPFSIFFSFIGWVYEKKGFKVDEGIGGERTN